MRAPVWFRKLRKKYRKPEAPTAPSPRDSALGNAKFRLKHQKTQILKAGHRYEYGTQPGVTKQQLKARLDGVIGKDCVVNGKTWPDKVAYWESEVARLKASEIDEHTVQLREWEMEPGQ